VSLSTLRFKSFLFFRRFTPSCPLPSSFFPTVSFKGCHPTRKAMSNPNLHPTGETCGKSGRLCLGRRNNLPILLRPKLRIRIVEFENKQVIWLATKAKGDTRMKSWIRSCFVLGVVLLAPKLWAQDSSRVLVVGDGDPRCAQAMYSRIQDAINEAPIGAKIHVCAGTYAEVLSITKPLTLTADEGAILMPQDVQANGVSLASGNPLAALLSVKDTTKVILSGLTVDAAMAGITECAPDLIGVLYQNASGAITGLKVRNTRLASWLNGCQSGLGIFVQSGNGGRSVVEIRGNQVSGYQKNGITANEAGTIVKISRNTITGVGPTTGAAQNGIQIGYGAEGEITKNSVSENIWSPCVSPNQCEWFSTGIAIVEASSVRVARNASSHNQVDIFSDGDGCWITLNYTSGAVVLDGIQIVGDGCIVQNNRVMDSDRAGIAIFGNGTVVRKNEIIDAPVGILKSSAAVGTDIGPNDFDNVGTEIVDPSPLVLGPFASNPVR